MWTPKRILLLLGGLFLFLLSFVVYAFFLGGIDGLPPLPIGCLPDENAKFVEGGPPNLEADVKLRQAFGPDCEELKRTIRVPIRSRGLVLAIQDFTIDEEDRRKVELTPFSAAIFGKSRGDDGFPEINTIKCDRAYLRFDRPIENLMALGDRKIIGAELHGRSIDLTNNRRTAGKSDDIVVHITEKPLFYSQKDNWIHSEGRVELIDTQAKPEQTRITGHGLDIRLIEETATASAKPGKEGAGAKKAPSTTVSGVKTLTLLSEVDMFFHIDAKSGFLGTNAVKNEEPAPPKVALAPDLSPPQPVVKAKPAKPSKVKINTEGTFTYHVDKDLAVFDGLPVREKQKQVIGDHFFPPERVTVHRLRPLEGGDDGEDDPMIAMVHDFLVCDHLELQFRKKKGAELNSTGQEQGGDREIDTARANCRSTKAINPDDDKVVVVLNTENLESYCDELVYRSPTAERGPETVLTGQPVTAIKDLHRIKATRVQLIGNNKQGEGQFAFAQGPGELHLIDPNKFSDQPKTKANPVAMYHAYWQDSLTVVKDKEKGRVFDRLTFKGDARFVDDSQKQDLHGDKLIVWLEQAERLEAEQPEKRTHDKASGAPHQLPHRLEAFGNVLVHSPDLKVHDCDYLIVNFNNAAPGELPDLADTAPGAKNNTVALTLSPGAPGTVKPAAAPGSSPPPGAPDAAAIKTPTVPGLTGSDPDKKSQQPVDLAAKHVRVEVVRTGARSDLKQVITDGNVHVVQEASKPGEKGIDITGDELQLFHHPEGDTLIVFGEPNAILQLGDLYLLGPEVRINQQDNTVAIKDAGTMTMPSATNFDGTKSNKPGQMLTVAWKDAMFFNGQDAVFDGNVHARQDESHLLCQNLRVYLDKMVSLKEGDKKGQGAKVEHLVAFGNVRVDDVKKDEKGQFVRQEKMSCPQLVMDNRDDTTRASGPGWVAVKQLGGDDGNPNKGKQPDQMFVTRIIFQNQVKSNKDADKNQIASFTGGVEVYHFPAEDINMPMTPEKLPKGGMYLTCERLDVYSRPGADGKSVQDMHALGNVFFQHNDVKGKAPQMYYNKSAERLILEGTVGNRALIQRMTPKGPEEFMANSFLYYRNTGLFSSKGVPSIKGIAK